jgi:hypothetical protein
MDNIEITHTLYSLRVAIACIYGALPADQKREVAAKLAQHLVLIEESRDVGMDGADVLLKVMDETFQSIQLASKIPPSFV